MNEFYRVEYVVGEDEHKTILFGRCDGQNFTFELTEEELVELSVMEHNLDHMKNDLLKNIAQRRMNDE